VGLQEQRREVPAADGRLHRDPPEEPRELGLGTDALGDAEQLERALGKIGVLAAAEGLVGDGLHPREQDDRLEGDGDRAGVEELLELPRAAHEAIGETAPAEGDGRRRLFLVRQRGFALDLGLGAEAELELREVEHVALADRDVHHAVAVEERAVPALEIVDAQDRAVGVDLGVVLRDRLRGEGELEPL
jgi:hypothetical protein